MSHNSSKPETVLLISLRHLGDTVIVAGFANALSERYPGISVDILGRQELREICTELCTVRDYIPIDVPVFGHHRKDIKTVFAALRTIAQIRQRRYDCCINLMGDFRENTIARVLGAKGVMAPVWTSDDPFRRHIRTSPWGRRLSELRSGKAGYYAAIESLAASMDLGRLCWPKFNGRQERQRSIPAVGIHPGASHASKQWPIAKWKLLIRRLAAKNVAIRLYGSPPEAVTLRRDFQSEIEELGMDFIVGGISGFLRSLATLDVLVCVDSFSSHAAHAVGTPAVVLYGPFDPAGMKPPTGTALSAGSRCAMFPCYNGWSCKNIENQYICIHAISVDAIVSAVEEKLKCIYTVNSSVLQEEGSAL